MRQLKMQDKLLVITHTDLDGYGSAIVAEHVFGNMPGGVFVKHLENKDVDRTILEMLSSGELSSYDHVYMTDLSVSSDVAGEIDMALEDGRLKDFVLLDHHKHALPLNIYSWAIVKIEHAPGILASGTSLFYDFLKTDWQLEPTPGLEYFVEMVRRYDTWEWFNLYKEEEAKLVNDLFGVYGGPYFSQHVLGYLQMKGPHVKLLDSNARHILAIERHRIDRYYEERVKGKAFSKFLNYSCVVVFADQYHSELGSRLHQDNPEKDMVVIVNPNDRKISFRTIHDNIDLSVLAKRLGGGGHSKAAGAPLTELTLEWAIRTLFK